MNTYLYNSSDKVLEVTHVDSKTLDDIEEVINLGKPQTVIDTFIGLYLPQLIQHKY